MHETMMKYKELKEKHPTIDHDLVMTFAEEMPDEFENALLIYEYGCHIVSKDMYREAVSYFENPDGTKGAKYTVEDIVQRSGIDFDKKEYTKLDFAYMVNMHFSDYGERIKDLDYLMFMAKHDLTDKDYPGDPTERAYHNAKKRIKYFEDEKE